MLFLGWASVKAQNTLYDNPEDQKIRTAVELLQKEKYGAARQTFNRYLKDYPNGVSQEEALYYQAYSALNLYHPDAESLYQDFVVKHDEHPKAPLAYYELGNFYFKQEDYPKAIEYFEQVPLAQLDGQRRLEARFKLAYGYFGQKQFDKALEKFNQIKTKESKYSAASSYYAGYIEYRNQDYDQALVDLQRAENSESYASLVPYLVANVYYKQGRFDELLAYTESVLENNSSRDFSELSLLAGEAYYFKGDYENAAVQYQKYADHTKRKLPPDTRYKYAFSTYHAGDIENSREAFKSLASRDEELGQFASYYLGDIYLKQDNLNYAVASFNKASQDDFSSEIKEAASFKYSKVQFDLGNYAQAIDGLEEFLQNYPESVYRAEAGDLLSEAYLGTNNYDQAIRHLESIENKSERASAAYQKVAYYRGTEFFNSGKYFNAVQMFEKSLDSPLDPELRVLAHYWSGEAYSIGKKYEQAIASYQEVLRGDSQTNQEVYVKASYGLAYAYYNTQQYTQALEQFNKFLQAYQEKKRFYDDALIRAADCNYVLKNYQEAINGYDQAIKRNSHDRDYALLQKGTVLSIAGDRSEARDIFTQLINDYQESKFVDKAVYQRAQLDLESGNYRQAVSGFTSLIQDHSKSQLIPYAHAKRALAHYNLKEYDRTINDYQVILNQYINHESAHDALIGLQETLNFLGRSQEFDNYLARYKTAHPENSSVANIEYESAVNLYLNENYTAAITRLQNFINAYPDNRQVFEAKFYLAESYYRSGQDQQAISNYQTVVAENKIAQLNRAWRRLGDLWFEQGDYQQAISSYRELESRATSKKENYYAWSGLMESYFIEGNYAEVDRYASMIIDQGGVNTNAVNRSMLLRGKAAYEQQQLDVATDYFLNTMNSAQDENGAEAQYMLAKIQFDQGLHNQSNETLYDLNTRFGGQSYWIGKSFLLVTDNYIKLDELFQARATLKSIIENAPEEEIVAEAKEKLTILDQVQEEELVEQDSLEIEVVDN